MRSFYPRIVKGLSSPLTKRLVLKEESQTDFYTRDHWWCDLSSQKCGLTHHFFDVVVPERLAFKPSFTKGYVRPGDVVGTLYYLCPIKKEIRFLTLKSPFAGFIESTNSRPIRGDLWLYKAKRIQGNDDLMDHLTYQSSILLA
jgi:hypothetical protein